MSTQELALFLYEEEQRLWVEFMDKTLSFGCLLKVKYFKQFQKICYFEHDRIYWVHDFINSWVETHCFREKNIEKILWHLWLSSILKYIWNNNWIIVGGYTWSDVIYWRDNLIVILTDGDQEYNFMFPNKELHLYTEQELKDLLDLLHKLKEWKT